MEVRLPLLPQVCCGSTTPPLAAADAAEIASRFKALADPTRVAILNQLALSDEICVCALTDSFELAQPTISHHLRVLREAGLVDVTRRGTWAYYRLVPDAVRPLRVALGGG